MNRTSAPIQTVAPVDTRDEANTRLKGYWLIVARIGWVACAVLTLTVFFASMPVYVAQLQTICFGTACAYRQLSPEQVTTLHALGLSLGWYTAYTVALAIISEAVCVAVSGVIFWRKSSDWMALLFALCLFLGGTGFVTETVAASHSVWSLPALLLNEFTFILFYLIASLFPNGRFVPRWTRWLIAVYIGVELWRISTLLSDSSSAQNRYPPLLLLFWFVITLSLGIAQVYRYRRVSSPVQRQQTKWIVFCLLVLILVSFGVDAPTLVFRSLNILYDVFAAALTTLVFLLFPLSVGVAILRYRLWDIDVLINRTLVYGSLSILLALVYFGCVFGLQSLFHLVTGQAADSPLIIVVSTLAIAALFQPFRQRIQRAIDRRFYRRKYDAAKTLAAFSSTLRGELDLTELGEQMVAVVNETMQPSHISLWLRQPEHQMHENLKHREPV
ncbi:MAG TPA: hypothetical protein VFQ30_15570 [Ktedonobacteraceae bacterium]|nr:hypothetical protein [Ktedonobacteraceae bacterium]